jgi:hypothetical protein
MLYRTEINCYCAPSPGSEYQVQDSSGRRGLHAGLSKIWGPSLWQGMMPKRELQSASTSCTCSHQSLVSTLAMSPACALHPVAC